MLLLEHAPIGIVIGTGMACQREPVQVHANVLDVRTKARVTTPSAGPGLQSEIALRSQSR